MWRSDCMRCYSFTLRQVLELTPDFTHAIVHHRFCESRRHCGRERPASWMELVVDELNQESLGMWSTCRSCHRRLRWRRFVAFVRRLQHRRKLVSPSGRAALPARG
jgi:hypothetical protein